MNNKKIKFDFNKTYVRIRRVQSINVFFKELSVTQKMMKKKH